MFVSFFPIMIFFFASLQRLILPIHTHLTRLGWWVGRGADEAAGDVCIAVEMCHWAGVAGMDGSGLDLTERCASPSTPHEVKSQRNSYGTWKSGSRNWHWVFGLQL